MDQFTQLLRAAQGGHGVETLAEIYGLSAQQAQRATEALMPAFAAALQRSMQSPDGMANLMVLMMRGPYGGLYEHPPAEPAELAKPGANVLDAVFGSPDVARAVADHAASTSGLTAAVLKQMMPAYGALLLGGMAKSLAASGAMSQLLAASLARASGQPLPTGNPWIDALGSFLAPSPPQQARGTGNPWIDSFAQMMVQSPFGLRGAAGQGRGNPWQDLADAIAASMETFHLPVPPAQPARAPAPAPAPAPRMAAPKAPQLPPPEPPAYGGTLPFQDYFAQLFTQGFPPNYSGFPTGQDGRTGFYPLDFWNEMLDRASGTTRGGRSRR